MIATKPKHDLAGRRFQRLLAIEFAGMLPVGTAGKRAAHWHCVCDCGARATVVARNLISGNSSNCGCVRKTKVARRNLTHGLTRRSDRHPLYNTWMNIKSRCTDANDPHYSSYGGRGITICDRWLNGDGIKAGFECFLDDVGERPLGASIDRADNNKGYHPGNVRWASRTDQARNRRSNRPVIRGDGARFSTMKEAAEVSGCRWWAIKDCLEGRAESAAGFTWKERK